MSSDISEMLLKSDSGSNRTSTRIAMLAPFLDRSDYWHPIFSEFTKLFPNTVVFTGYWPGYLAGYEDTFKVQLLRGYKYIILETAPTGGDIGVMWAPPSVLWELLRLRPAVIFTSAFSIWTLYALIFKAFARCRVIIGWEGNSPCTTYLDRPIRLRVRRIMARFVDAAYSNTREGIDYLRRVLGIPDSKLLHYPYQVPEVSALRLNQRESSPSWDCHPIFLFVGSILKRKGWRYLVEATSRLQREMPHSFSVVFAGKGPEMEQLRQSVSSTSLLGVVHVVGAVPYRDLGAYFQACDVLVLPTLEDTWGMVVLEAMAFGKPVLCSKYAGSKEMVRHGVNGFIFDPYNTQELADYMAQFIRKPHLIAEFGRMSSEIIAPYTPQRSATVLAGLVSKVLDRTTTPEVQPEGDAALG
jgi:glycosyltransferase involved in cell wall biosynthesis